MQRQGLLYATSAIDIATGATPEVNLLDMMTFLTLSKEAIREHWIPIVFKQHAEKLLRVFEKSEKEIWEIAAKVSSEKERNYFRDVIHEWKKENPGQYRVESIRLTGLSRTAGNIEDKRSKKISGILVAIKGASASADQAVLLANRAMFLAQRMPFLIRMHTRIGAKDIIQDTFGWVHEADELMQEMQEFDPMISNLAILTERTELTLKQLENVLKVYRANFPSDPNSTIGQKLSSIERILNKADPITKRLLEVNSERAENIINTFREQIERLILITFFSMLFLILAWWGGYYWTKRKIAVRNSLE